MSSSSLSPALRPATLFRSSALVLGALLALVACTSTTPSTSGPSAAVSLDEASTACAPNVGAAPTAYPNWPGGGQAVATNQDVIPYIVSSDLAVGPNRFLVTVIDSRNNNIAAPGLQMGLSFFNLAADPNTAVATSPGTYYDNGAGNGLYRGSVIFPCWGDWGVEVKVTSASSSNTARVVFDVEATSSSIGIGEKAPPVDTPTATDAAGMAAISTDTTPDPDFYRMTITQAETAGKPALIIFATPAFCKTATCGPTLDLVNTVAQGFKSTVNFVHVEPYQLQMTPTGLQPVLDPKGELQTVPAADDFGLISEPFTFVLDAQGRVAYKFDGIMGTDELTAALDAVTGVTAPAASAAAASGAPASP